MNQTTNSQTVPQQKQQQQQQEQPQQQQQKQNVASKKPLARSVSMPQVIHIQAP
jgi:hypothetical protein